MSFPKGNWRLRLDSALAETTPVSLEQGAAQILLSPCAMLAYSSDL